MKTIRSTFIVALLGTSVLAGCKGKTGVDIDNLSMASFDTALAIKDRTSSEADVKAALKTMQLDDVSGPFEWTDVSVTGSTVTFSDFRNDADSFDVKKLVLSGVHADGFDKVELNGLTADIKFEQAAGNPDLPMNMTVTMSSFMAANPQKDKAAEFIKSLNSDGMSMVVPIGFQGTVSKDYTIYLNGDKIGTAQSYGTGIAADGTYYSYTENFDMDMTDFMGGMLADAGTPMPEMKIVMNIGTMKMTGMSPEYVNQMSKMMEGNFMVGGNAMRNMSYEKMVIENSSGEIMGAKFDMPLLDATGSKSGDTFTQKQTIKGASLSFDNSNPQVASVLTDLGMMTMPFDGYFESHSNFAKDTMKITEGRMDFKDQFTFNMMMDTSGMMAYQEKLAELGMDALTKKDDIVVSAIPMYDINSLSFSITDQSIMDRIWTMAAKMQNIDDVDMMKSQAKGLLAMGAMSAGSDTQKALIGNMSGAINGFIDQSGTLTIGMKPAKGFFKMVDNPGGDPDKMIDSMGLSFSHTPPAE